MFLSPFRVLTLNICPSGLHRSSKETPFFNKLPIFFTTGLWVQSLKTLDIYRFKPMADFDFYALLLSFFQAYLQRIQGTVHPDDFIYYFQIKIIKESVTYLSKIFAHSDKIPCFTLP